MLICGERFEVELADERYSWALRCVTASARSRERVKAYSAQRLLDPAGELLAVYRKMHLFGFTSEEATLLTPGEVVTGWLRTWRETRAPQPTRISIHSWD